MSAEFGKRLVAEMIENLNRNVSASMERRARWGRIMDIEESKWRYRLPEFFRKMLPRWFPPFLEGHITKAQEIAREAAWTAETTEEYLRKHQNKA